MPNKKSGFTLIELLVVITVIGVLSGVLLGVINSTGVRAKARDAQRKADLKKIQTALELYFADNRQYPESDGADGAAPYNHGWEQVNPDKTNAMVDALQDNGYINPVPIDPVVDENWNNNGPCSNPEFQRYNYISDGSYYYLTALMEVETSKDDSPCTGTGVETLCSTFYDSGDVCYVAQNP